MTDKGKLVYERLKNECLPNIHKLSILDKYDLIQANKITTNLPPSFWENIKRYYSSAEWESTIFEPYPESNSKHYTLARYKFNNENEIEYFSVLYLQDKIYAEYGCFDISDFEPLVTEEIENSKITGRPIKSNLEIVLNACSSTYYNTDNYKQEVKTYSLMNPSVMEETRVTKEQLMIMIKALNIDEKDIEPPAKFKQGVYER